MLRRWILLVAAMAMLIPFLPTPAGANVFFPSYCPANGQSHGGFGRHWSDFCWVGPPGQYTDTGPLVGVIQTVMQKYQGQYVAIDCLWGPNTQAELWRFQANHNVIADPPAVAGNETWGDLSFVVPAQGTAYDGGNVWSDYYGASFDNIFRFRYQWFYGDRNYGNWYWWTKTASWPSSHWEPISAYNAEKCALG